MTVVLLTVLALVALIVPPWGRGYSLTDTLFFGKGDLMIPA